MKLGSILKQFEKTLTKLEEYQTQADKEIEETHKKMVELESNNIRNRRDRDRAAKAANSLRELIGDNE